MDRMDRRWSNLPREQLDALAASAGPDTYASDWMTDSAHFAYAGIMENRKLHLRFEDGYAMTYDFYDQKFLRWSDSSGEGGTCFYRALEAPGHADVVFVHHYCDGKVPAACIDLVLDFQTGSCTAVLARIGLRDAYPRDVSHTIRFGQIDSIPRPDGAVPPHFTTELVGKAILWEMPAFTGKPPIKHIYLSPKYYGIHLTREDQCYMCTDPADYIKIRDGLYFLSIVEARRSGIQLSFLINTELLEDVVGHFGISAGNELGQDEPRIVCTVITGRKGRFVPMETLP